MARFGRTQEHSSLVLGVTNRYAHTLTLYLPVTTAIDTYSDRWWAHGFKEHSRLGEFRWGCVKSVFEMCGEVFNGSMYDLRHIGIGLMVESGMTRDQIVSRTNHTSAAVDTYIAKNNNDKGFIKTQALITETMNAMSSDAVSQPKGLFRYVSKLQTRRSRVQFVKKQKKHRNK